MNVESLVSLWYRGDNGELDEDEEMPSLKDQSEMRHIFRNMSVRELWDLICRMIKTGLLKQKEIVDFVEWIAVLS